VHVLAWHVAAGQSHEFAGIDLGWARSLVTEAGWNPSSVHDQGSTFDLDCLTLSESFSHGELTTFVTEEWVDNVEAIHGNTVDPLLTWNQHLLRQIKLSKHEVWLESVIDFPLLFRHAPPCEVLLSPWGAVDHLLIHFVVGRGTLEVLAQVKSVLEVSKGASKQSCKDCALHYLPLLLARHALEGKRELVLSKSRHAPCKTL